MIRRVAWISVVGHKLKLGIKHEKALREQTAVSDKASEHVVEQFRTAAGSRGVERVEKSIVEDIHRVERNSSPKPRAFGTDVGYAQRHVMAEIAHNFEIEVLNVWSHTVGGAHRNRLVSAAIQWNGFKRCELLGYRQAEIRQ